MKTEASSFSDVVFSSHLEFWTMNHSIKTVILCYGIPSELFRTRRIPSHGMLLCVALVRTDVSEEHTASIIEVKRIVVLGTTLAITNNGSRLRRNSIPSETSVLTIATRRRIPKDGILNSHRRENLKSYVILTDFALYRRHLKYELNSYIPEDGILHSQILHFEPTDTAGIGQGT
jgi:hypothetical protein